MKHSKKLVTLSVLTTMSGAAIYFLNKTLDTAAVRKRGAAGQNIFQIGADRVCRQVFLIHIGELQIETAVRVAGIPSECIECLADCDIVSGPVIKRAQQHGVE